MKAFAKAALMALLASMFIAAGLPARDKLPPQARRTFHDPADYVPDVTEKPTRSELRDLVTRYVADKQLLNRFHSVPGSQTRREILAGFYSAWLKELPKIDFDRLSRDGQADYVLLRNLIEYDRLVIEREDRLARSIAPLVPFVEDLAKLQEDRQRLDFIGADEAVAALGRVLDGVMAAQAAVDSGQSAASPILAFKAARLIAQTQWALEDWFAFYNGYDPDFTAKVPPSYESLNQALDAYIETIRVKLAGIPVGVGDPGLRRRGRGLEAPVAGRPASEMKSTPIIANPVGREALVEELKGAMIAYTPEQIIEIGNREYAWCVAEMKKAAREMGFGDDWRAALEKVKQGYVPRGDQPDLIRNLQIQAETFIRERGLLTIPPIVHDTWQLVMKPPRAMMFAPFFNGGESIFVSYPTEGMPEQIALMIMKGNGPHLSHATVFH